jgi:hypothetical protein
MVRCAIEGRAGGIADRAANAAGRGGFQADAALIERLGNAVEANPNTAGVDALQRAIKSFAEAMESKDAADARKFREMAQDLERVKAKLKTGGDGK